MFKLVKCKSLIDGTGAQAAANACLLIEGDRIADIGVEAAFRDLPPGTEILDFGHSYVMPGLVNAHTHLSLVPGKGNQPAQKRLPPRHQRAQKHPQPFEGRLFGRHHDENYG